MIITPDRQRWSFPQLLSTYRFWSLLLMVMFVMLAVVLIREGHLQFLRDREHHTYDGKGDAGEFYFQMRLVIQLGGLALGAGLSRWISVRGLVTGISGCALACLLTLLIGESWSTPLQWLSFVSSEALLSVLTVAIPALIATRMRSVLAITSAFAVLSLTQVGIQLLVVSWPIMPLLAGGDSTAMKASAFCMLIAAACVVLPNRTLHFRRAPERSVLRRAPKHRLSLDVAGVGALLWIVYPLAILGITLTSARGSVPVIWIGLASLLALFSIWYSARWFHHIHAEAATLSAVDTLFTARAALWIYLLMPLGGPLLLLSLGSNLYREMRRQRLKPIRAEKWFSVFAVVVPPLAMGMAQSMMNALGATSPGERITAAARGRGS
ncbi:hypothetical protein ABE424_00655 [Stenotrophomonas sp. TWI1149]|uniref:hypothetical protein n=1 Tax=unclassified Stenotrophomonas TaxID=196198 RepID=UPI0032093DA7